MRGRVDNVGSVYVLKGENMNDYVVIFQNGEKRRIRPVNYIKVEDGCVYFYEERNVVIGIFSIANIIGIYKEKE